MSLPRYPKYKDSGVEWLGEVPEHWSVTRLKYACDVFPSNVDKKSYPDELPTLLCNYTDVYYADTITADMEFMAATASEAQIAKFSLRAGDTIITKDSETADDIAIAAHVPQDLPGVVCGYHLSMVRPKEGTHGAFVKRLFDAAYTKSCFAVVANGLTRVGLGQYELDNVELPFPPVAEQVEIAAFLDRETAKIDALVAEQRRLMELLKEKRQAVISHAVTKGLNPDCHTKPSYIELVESIPSHWRTSSIRRLISAPVTNGIFKKKDEFGSGTLLVNVYDIYRADFTVDFESLERVKCDAEEQNQFGVSHGDLLFVRSSLKEQGIAVVAHVGSHLEPAVFECHLIRVRFDRTRMLGRFASYLLNTPAYRCLMIREAKVTTMTTIDQEAILSTVLPVPPLSEQQDIIAHLERETAKLDALTAEAQRAIDLLQERRTALISAAVTGQIDVRNLV